jgi:hypothetical protein
LPYEAVNIEANTSERERRVWPALAGLALMLVVALAGAGTPSDVQAVPLAGGSMAVDCDAGQAGIQASCSYPAGETFDVQVHVVAAPAAGHFGFQAKLRWPDGSISYQPAASQVTERVWAGCTIPSRNVNVPDDPSVVYGCIPFPLPAQGIIETGAMVQFEFECGAASTPAGPNLLLVPRAGDSQFGTHFLDQMFSPIDPVLADATVDCSAPPDPDGDDDGCMDDQETGDDPLTGGDRDPEDFWDFFDTPDDQNARDKAVAAGDLARLVQRFGSNDSGAGAFDRADDPLSAPDAPVTPAGDRDNYHPAFDRSPSQSTLSGPADGIIATGDIALLVGQFGHSCAS